MEQYSSCEAVCFSYYFVHPDFMLIRVAARLKAQVYGRSPAEIVGLNPTGAWMFVCSECRVLSGRGLGSSGAVVSTVVRRFA